MIEVLVKCKKKDLRDAKNLKKDVIQANRDFGWGLSLKWKFEVK